VAMIEAPAATEGGQVHDYDPNLFWTGLTLPWVFQAFFLDTHGGMVGLSPPPGSGVGSTKEQVV
jgi:hypothetical protein